MYNTVTMFFFFRGANWVYMYMYIYIVDTHCLPSVSVRIAVQPLVIRMAGGRKKTPSLYDCTLMYKCPRTVYVSMYTCTNINGEYRTSTNASTLLLTISLPLLVLQRKCNKVHVHVHNQYNLHVHCTQ